MTSQQFPPIQWWNFLWQEKQAAGRVSAPDFELIIPGRIDKWLDAHIIKQPRHLPNLDVYTGINSSGLPCMRDKTQRDLSPIL